MPRNSADVSNLTDDLIIHLTHSVLFSFFLREGICATLSPAWAQSCLQESPAASPIPPSTAPLSPRGHPRSAPCGMWSPVTSLCRARRDSFGEQMDSSSRAGQKGKFPHFPHHPAPSPAGSSQFSAPVPTAGTPRMYGPAPGSGPSDQKLAELWKKSPQKKLEQLKKKIQKQKQQAASQVQECQAAARAGGLPPKSPLRRKVCTVVLAPPAPVCRGQ